MDLSSLTDLPILPLQVTAVATSALRLPDHPGSSLRGAFGAALKRLVCSRAELRTCEPCPHVAECPYPRLFDPRAVPGAEGVVGFEDLPRPYVFWGLVDTAPAKPGDFLGWRVTLVGEAIRDLPYFVLAWQSMGQEGVGTGRGRFCLSSVDALDPLGGVSECLYDRVTNCLRPPSTTLGGDAMAAWAQSALSRLRDASPLLRVRFLTPTSLKYRKQRVETPEFHVLWRCLQRRLSLLRLAYGAGRPPIDFSAAIGMAESIELVGWEGRQRQWKRRSQRQGRRVPMGGFVGAAHYRGDLAPFLPALKLGTLLGVGDNCTFGQGQFEIALSSEAS